MIYEPIIQIDHDDISQIFDKYSLGYGSLENCKGRAYLDSLEIKINSGMCEYETRITLMHEILHAHYEDFNEMRLWDEGIIEEEARYYIENHSDLVDFAMKYLEKD